jgi:hypothetical protein
VKASVTTFGHRFGEVSVPELATLADAQNWAIGYFGIHADAVSAHRLELALGAWDTEIKPDGLVKLLGSSIDAAFPVAIHYSLGGDNLLNVSVDLNRERPSFESMLQRVILKAQGKTT